MYERRSRPATSTAPGFSSFFWGGGGVVRLRLLRCVATPRIGHPPAVETMELKRGAEEGNFCMFSAEPMEPVLDPERYSKWSHLLRLMAWVIRFLQNCKRCRDGAPKLKGELTVNEFEDAKRSLLVRHTTKLLVKTLLQLSATNLYHQQDSVLAASTRRE